MLRQLCFSALISVSTALATPAMAQQDQRLADIRLELTALYQEILALKSELQASGTAQATGGSGPLITRIDTVETELRALTGQVEALEFRIDQIVKDGTNRVGDLEFRIVELEGGDVTQLDRTKPLGGGALPETPAIPVAPEPAGDLNTGAELAVAEREDFELATAAYQAGKYAEAAERFERFAQTYTGGPLTGDALYWRGSALAALGDWKPAARSFLDSFSGSPKGTHAADALRQLGVALAQLGKKPEACQTLAAVNERYPGSPTVVMAQNDMSSLGCS